MRLWGGGQAAEPVVDQVLGSGEKDERLKELRGKLLKLGVQCGFVPIDDTDDNHTQEPAAVVEEGEGETASEFTDERKAEVEKLEPVEDVTMRRFLRAYEYDTQLASERIMKMLRWRGSKSYGLDIMVKDIDNSTEAVPEQIGSGKCLILKGRDLIGRPIISVHVRKHIPSKQSPDELTRFGVHILKSAEAILTSEGAKIKEEDQQFCIIFDLQGVRLQNIDYDACKRIIYMLTYFFPERMGICLLVGAPLFFSAAWHIIKPWLHARTQKKILFCQLSQLGQHVAPENLPEWLGGNSKDECQSNEYSQP